MKNHNKILEAINRGIQLALDDFDDDEMQNIKSKQIYNRDYTKEYLDLLRDEVVDLELPSGTLWCKYNLGVDPNQLFEVEDWYGDYYAWGELKPNKAKKNKIYFDWDNYKFRKNHKLSKYCNKSEHGLNGFTDNLTELLPEDDAAYQNKKFYNFKFHIPTKEQLEELLRFTQNYWVNDYNPNNIEHHINDDGINGLNGRVFIGQNGNQLFIPAAGYHIGSNIYEVGSDCYLWSSSLYLDDPISAYSLNFNSDRITVYNYDRCFGFSVCPVINL